MQEGAVSLQAAVAELKSACNAQPTADTICPRPEMSLPEPPSFVFWNEGGTYVLYAASLNPGNLQRSRRSDDQHRVAVAVEPVTLLNGLAIRRQDPLTPGERRHEHQQ